MPKISRTDLEQYMCYLARWNRIDCYKECIYCTFCGQDVLLPGLLFVAEAHIKVR